MTKNVDSAQIEAAIELHLPNSAKHDEIEKTEARQSKYIHLAELEHRQWNIEASLVTALKELTNAEQQVARLRSEWLAAQEEINAQLEASSIDKSIPEVIGSWPQEEDE